jgi:hypothetical protein
MNSGETPRMATPEDLDERTLEGITLQLQSTCYDAPEKELDSNRAAITKCLQTPFEYREGEKNKLRNLVGSEDSKKGLFIIKEGGEAASVAGYKLFGRTKDNRDAFLLTSRVTLPGYEGKGYSKEIDKTRLERLHKDFPRAILIVMTRNHIVKGMTIKNKFEPISFRKFFELQANLEGESEEWVDKWVTHMDRGAGWQCYMKDPLMNGSD